MQELTSRQQAIFDLLLNGASPKEIAQKLNISYNTLLTHQKKLYRKLGINSVQELIAKYSSGIAEQEITSIPAHKNRLTGRWWGGFLCGVITCAVVLLVVLLLMRVGQHNETTLVAHSFDAIQLRANRWNNYNKPLEQDMPAHGENWTTQLRISVTDLPAHIDRITSSPDRYAITISGTSNQDMDFIVVWLYGITMDNNYLCFGETDTDHYIQIKANSPFNETRPVHIISECNLADFKEIEMEFTNEMQYINEEKPGYNRILGSIPADIPDGTIMATIGNFTISLNDTRK